MSFGSLHSRLHMAPSCGTSCLRSMVRICAARRSSQCAGAAARSASPRPYCSSWWLHSVSLSKTSALQAMVHGAMAKPYTRCGHTSGQLHSRMPCGSETLKYSGARRNNYAP